eukprot:gb/GECH01012110.1/.p1 GENE.gb/GECH01012110.1/~~gb/GECH01012110.1/.p1  ORF type:complete len:335 (+),score=99.83 gb/GECH01012110.1/:1-1005(+)
MADIRSKKFNRHHGEVDAANVTKRRLRSRPFVDYSSMVGKNPTSRDVQGEGESSWNREWTGRKKIYNNMTKETEVDTIHKEAVYDAEEETPLSRQDKENMKRLNNGINQLSLRKKNKGASKPKTRRSKPSEEQTHDEKVEEQQEQEVVTKSTGKSKSKQEKSSASKKKSDSKPAEHESTEETSPAQNKSSKSHSKPLSKRVRKEMERLNAEIPDTIPEEIDVLPINQSLKEFLSPDAWLDYYYSSKDNNLFNYRFGHVDIEEDVKESYPFFKENPEAVVIADSEESEVLICTIPKETTHPQIYLSDPEGTVGPFKLSIFLASCECSGEIPPEEE